MTIRVPSSRLSQHNFSQIPGQNIQRSVFERSFTHKTTPDIIPSETLLMNSYLYPICIEEVLPGDTWSMSCNILVRLEPTIVPIMDNIWADVHAFFVPNRLVWEHWEEFISPGSRTAVSPPPVEYLIPALIGDPLFVDEFSLLDYMGLPLGNITAEDISISALPFRGYELIYNEWFRPQSVAGAISVPTDDGPDDYTQYAGLNSRSRRHDYFSSALPYPQKGDAVPIPISGSGVFPVAGDGTVLGLTNGSSNFGVGYTGTSGFDGTMILGATGYGTDVGSGSVSGRPTGALSVGVTTDPDNSGLVALVDSSYVGTINELRQAFAFQQILELDARAGTRYVEHLKAHWQVVSPDFRLQRPEYLGGYSERINIHAVPQTSQPNAGAPQGQLAGYGTSFLKKGIHYSAVEHGYLFWLLSFRADTTYQQNIRKMWTRQTRFDFYLPLLAHLGEQAVLNYEIFYDETGAFFPMDVYGYQERWAEYRYSPSYVTGAMRSENSLSLDSWHLALDFDNPTLSYVTVDGRFPLGRCMATLDVPPMEIDCYFDAKWARAMPVYSVPGLERL